MAAAAKRQGENRKEQVLHGSLAQRKPISGAEKFSGITANSYAGCKASRYEPPRIVVHLSWLLARLKLSSTFWLGVTGSSTISQTLPRMLNKGPVPALTAVT